MSDADKYEAGARLERERIRKLALEPSEKMVEHVAMSIARVHSDATGCCFPGDVCEAQSSGLPCYCLEGSRKEARAVLRAFAEEIGR